MNLLNEGNTGFMYLSTYFTILLNYSYRNFKNFRSCCFHLFPLKIKLKVKSKKGETKDHKSLQKWNTERNSKILHCDFPPALIGAIKRDQYHKEKSSNKGVLFLVTTILQPSSRTIMRKVRQLPDSSVIAGKKMVFTVSLNLLWDSCHMGFLMKSGLEDSSSLPVILNQNF